MKNSFLRLFVSVLSVGASLSAAATAQHGPPTNMLDISLIIALSVVLAVALAATLYQWQGRRREVINLRRMERRLERANQAKEIYIARFLELCADYLEIMDDYNRTCKRKASTGMLDDLMTFLKSDAAVDRMQRKFYDLFDEAFLKMYPTFVADVNALLLPDRRIDPPTDRELTTELRILAFGRLGVEDTARIARFLGISPNTVYTYRNKLRNRAADRTLFEEQIRSIGSPSDRRSE